MRHRFKTSKVPTFVRERRSSDPADTQRVDFKSSSLGLWQKLFLTGGRRGPTPSADSCRCRCSCCAEALEDIAMPAALERERGDQQSCWKVASACALRNCKQRALRDPELSDYFCIPRPGAEIRPQIDRCGPALAEYLWSTLSNGPRWAEICQAWSNMGRHGPHLGRTLPTLFELGVKHVPSSAQIRPSSICASNSVREFQCGRISTGSRRPRGDATLRQLLALA